MKVRTTVTLDPKVLEKLKQMSKDKDRSVSSIINMLVKEAK